MTMELRITDLSKTYPNGVRALDGVTLTVPTGMFGLLGPNGAGKSTLMRTIATLQEPDTGSIELDGIDVIRDKDRVRRLLGYLPQEFGVYPRISAEVDRATIRLLERGKDAHQRGLAGAVGAKQSVHPCGNGETDVLQRVDAVGVRLGDAADVEHAFSGVRERGKCLFTPMPSSTLCLKAQSLGSACPEIVL